MDAPISDVEDKRCSAHSSNTWKSQFCVYKFDDQWLDYIAQTKTKWLFRLHNMFDMPNSYWYNILQNCWFINLLICLREGFTKKSTKKSGDLPPSPPPPRLGVFTNKKLTHNFFLIMNHWCVKLILHLVPPKILIFAFVISVYICPK